MNIAVLDDYQAIAHAIVDWGVLGEGVRVEFLTEHLEDEALVERIADCDIVVAMRERTAFPARVLQGLPKLRLLVTTGMRNRAIDVRAATDAGILVCGTHGLTWSTAELTWGLVIASVRNLIVETASMRAGGWQRTIGTDLSGRTLGVVGLGHLGARVAGYGLAFDMRVVAWSPHLSVERAAEHGVSYLPREELFVQADVISIHMVLGPQTRGLITEADLRRMKPTSYLINTSRGPLVEEAALVRALREGWIAGAALDVYDTEPLPADHELRKLGNCVLTPHIGYVTRDTYANFFAGVLEDIQAFLADSPIRQLA
ncbi:MAG: D-2-hydroxyacid dehydrogenase family protein [Candidatus Dormiibacterota bacterium]